MDDLLGTFLGHYDPLYLGIGRRGLANGMHASVGQSFPRADGGYNLYRGTGTLSAINWSEPVGAAGAVSVEIENFPEHVHDTNAVYYYAVKAISPGGVEQESELEYATLRFDAAGQAIDPPVNPAADVVAVAISGGRFRLTWYYRSGHSEPAPREFRIYSDGGSETVDYATLVAVIPFEIWRSFYDFESTAFVHGGVVKWSVRTANTNGREERNTVTVSATADDQGPIPLPVARIE